jgi:DNA primase
MDWLLVEYLEDYVELDNAQEDLVERKIEVLSEWHRREEIPHYIDHLDELMAIEPQSFTIEQLQAQQDKIQQHSLRLVARIAPEMYALARELSDSQVDELMDSIRVRHTKYKKKYQKLSEVEIKARYKERIVDSLETWMDDLTQDQLKIVDDWVDDLYVTTDDWINYQTNMRIEMNSLLDRRLNVASFQPQFNKLMFNPDSLYPPHLEEKIEYNKQVGNQFLIRVINAMTEEQTEYYREELQDWKDLAQSVL